MHEHFSLSPDADDLPNGSVQDRDLLLRMTAYCDTLDARVRQGQGWLIFNADRRRSARIAQYLLLALRGRSSTITHSLMTWRDFALNAFVTQIALPREEREEPEPAPESDRDRERRIARRVSREAYWRALNVDLFILLDLAPSHAHEVEFLDGILASRARLRLPSVLTTPLMPDGLRGAIAAQDAGGEVWERLWRMMCDTSLIAM